MAKPSLHTSKEGKFLKKPAMCFPSNNVDFRMAVDEAPCGHSMMCGSSSGPAASVAAGFAPVSIGTETTGSLVIPANRGALYSLKIGTAKATPVKRQALCISKTYDSLGAMTKSARDLTDMTRIILGTSCEHESKCNRGSQIANVLNSPRLRLGFVDIDVWQYPDFMCPLNTEIREILVSEELSRQDCKIQLI